MAIPDRRAVRRFGVLTRYVLSSLLLFRGKRRSGRKSPEVADDAADAKAEAEVQADF